MDQKWEHWVMNSLKIKFQNPLLFVRVGTLLLKERDLN